MSSSRTNANPQKLMRRDIQALRGWSVLCVILFHLKPNYFSGGFLGVDIFFVVSGFVMAPQILKLLNAEYGQFFPEYKLYLERRFWRLIPALSVASFFLGILLIAFIDIHEIGNTLRQLLLSLLGLANVGAYAISGDYFSPHGNPFLHNWSLSVEIQFYLLLPILFLGLTLLIRFINRSLLPGFFFVVSVTLFFADSFLTRLISVFGIQDSYGIAWYYMPFSRAWEFLAGYIAWYLSSNLKSTRFQQGASYILLLAIPIFAFADQLGPKFSIFMIVAVSSLYLLSSNPAPRLGRSKIMNSLGDSSYSLYLVHLPIIYLFQFSPNTEFLRHLYGADILPILLILFSGFILNHFIERQLNYRKISKFTNSRKVVIAIVLVVTPIVSFGSGLLNLGHIIHKFSISQEENGATWLWDSGCEFYQTPRSSENSVCSYPLAAGRADVLLIGDSHAAVLSEDFVKVSHKLSLNAHISTFEGCPYSINARFLKSVTGNSFSKCLSHNVFITKWIELNSPDIIIYSQRGILGYSNGEIRISESSVRRFNTFVGEFQSLSSSTRELVRISPVPELAPFSVFDRLQDNEIRFDSRSFLPDYERQSNPLKNEVVLNTRQVICPKGKCISNVGSNRIYRDSNHLSKYGSAMINQKLFYTLDAMLRG